MSHLPIKAVLFDLDGTLLDSAPDMLATVNTMLSKRDLAEISLDIIRCTVSRGGKTMLAAAFPLLNEVEIEELLPEFLDTYQSLLGQYSRLFNEVEELLIDIENQGMVWGVITNKPEYLARQIIQQLHWETRCKVLIGGDTLEHRKPHPLPLQTSAQQLNLSVDECIYIGDDIRDIQSANAAGMRSFAAAWGYYDNAQPPSEWNATGIFQHPKDIQLFLI